MLVAPAPTRLPILQYAAGILVPAAVAAFLYARGEYNALGWGLGYAWAALPVFGLLSGSRAAMVFALCAASFGFQEAAVNAGLLRSGSGIVFLWPVPAALLDALLRGPGSLVSVALKNALGAAVLAVIGVIFTGFLSWVVPGIDVDGGSVVISFMIGPVWAAGAAAGTVLGGVALGVVGRTMAASPPSAPTRLE